MKNIQTAITEVWQKIDDSMNIDSRMITSEKSIVFNFAWEFAKRFESANIDFETTLFGEFSDGQFLDLYISLISENIEYRIGFEFKFPKRVNHNSDRTETRQKIINDLKRLNWLTQNNEIDFGCFLCLTNEASYTIPKKYKIADQFLTHHGKQYLANDFFPENLKYSEKVRASNNIEFKWNYINSNSKYLISEKKYIFLEPIFITRSTNA